MFPGRSLERCWLEPEREEPEGLNPVLSELFNVSWRVGMPVGKGDMKSLIIGNMHFIRNGDGAEEVYDLLEDSVELNNLIGTPRGADAAEQARRILEGILP